jgi:hypothetical protein
MSATAPVRARDQPAWAWLLLVSFGGTLLWAVRFAVAYLLVPTACLVGDWLLHVVGLVTILAALVVVLVNLRWARQPWATPACFLLAVGLALNVFFLAVTVLESSAVLFVDACAKGAIP